MHARWIFFDAEIDDAYSGELLFDFPVIPPQGMSDRLSAALDKIFSASHPCERMSICYGIAKELLASTGESVEKIARAVGIEDAHYFSRLFKRKYNMIPMVYRRNIVF